MNTEIDHDSNILKHMRSDHEALKAVLSNMAEVYFPPAAIKSLKRFSTVQSAGWVGVSRAHFNNHADEIGLVPELVGKAKQRFYTLADINVVRQHLAKKTTSPEKSKLYDPRRREGDELAVLSCVNFKGGSAKSTTAVHFAQYLALKGYRVLLIDLDPQGSASGMMGIIPERVTHDESLYAAIRYDNPLPMSQVAKKTYFENLDIVPSGLWVADWEFDAPRVTTSTMDEERELRRRLAEVESDLAVPNLPRAEYERLTKKADELRFRMRGMSLQRLYFLRLQAALIDVQDEYDVVVCDTAPSLGYLSNASIGASNHLLLTIQPQMLDCESMAQYLMTSITHQEQYEAAVKRALGPEYVTDKTLHYLITRFNTASTPQNDVAKILRRYLANVLDHSMVNTTAVEEARTRQLTLYESDRSQFNPKTYDRAIESMNEANVEIEKIILQGWGRL